MTGIEKWIDQLGNVYIRRCREAGIVTTPEVEESIRAYLKHEWETNGYDSARVVAERGALLALTS